MLSKSNIWYVLSNQSRPENFLKFPQQAVVATNVHYCNGSHNTIQYKKGKSSEGGFKSDRKPLGNKKLEKVELLGMNIEEKKG